MSNLPPGCTPNDIDRAQGWKPLRECDSALEAWDWHQANSSVNPPFTAELWDELMATTDAERDRIIDLYGLVWLWEESRKNP